MIRKLAMGLVGIVLAAACGTWMVLRMSVVAPGGEWGVGGLDDALDIRFDDNLRPYVEAQSLEDALLAEGWLHARYRLWQMELLRRAGKGRLAEALGENMLETDKSLWRAGVPQLARRLVRTASPEMLERVDAYLAGVNAGVASYRVRPPELLLTGIEVRPWTRLDVFAVGALIAFQSAANMSNERLRLSLAAVLDDRYFAVFVPDESGMPGFPYVIRDPRFLVASRFVESLDRFERQLLPSASLGSSGWVVAPSRSASGHALFAFDSHDALNLPNLFYEVHLFYGHGRSIRGWSLPGLPGVINGFNEHIAWGLTNIGDTQDLYVETRNPENPREFLLDGNWYEAESQFVDIPVKGRNEPERVEILFTANGPLIEDDPAIALRWTGHDLGQRGMDALLAMNTATDWASFEAALSLHAAPTANVTYADRSGRIAFRTIGLIPRRGTSRGLVPLVGYRSDNAWQGYVSDGDLPLSVDPEFGYIAAANARVHSGEPVVSADNAPGYRMQRLLDVLGGRGDLELADMQALQLDTWNAQAARLLPHMLPAERDAWQDEEDLAMDWLTDWLDAPTNDADSAGALIWEHWYIALARDVFGPQLDDDLLDRLIGANYLLNHALDRLITDDHDSPWWRGQRAEILRQTLRDTLTTLSASFGPDLQQWRWDGVQAVSFRHELHGISPLSDNWLSRGPFPWGGGHAMLARARYAYNQPFEGRAGATVRVVAEMSTPIRVRSVIPGGQHGHPASEHYDDQLDTWLHGQLYDIAASPQQVDGSVTRLIPAP